MSIDYLMIGSNDLTRSRVFYDAVMSHLGAAIAHEYEGITFCYKMRDGVRLWVAKPHNGESATPSNGSMPGYICESEEGVAAAHAAALAHGGSDEGAPGPRPLYGPDFYGAYVRDPDGNKMSFVFMRVSEA